jgi:plasmid maintenance system antidote protein VapI
MFKEWMERNDLTPIDIAAALRIHPNTVLNYIKGKVVLRSTQAMLERFVESYEQSKSKVKAVS